MMMVPFVSEHSILYRINVSSGGVPKLPVPEAAVTVDGIVGDGQRNRTLHGGPDRAICLFSLELIQMLQKEGHRVSPGSTGENLTLAGVRWQELRPGDRMYIGDSVCLEITDYCEPCRKNARWFLQDDYQRISHARHPGWSRLYARVLDEGRIHRGDRVRIVTPSANRR